MRGGQDSDTEISQFGIGMKAGAISTADKLEVITRVDNNFIKVEMDFIEMINRENPINSFNPKKYNISKDEYFDKHSFKFGSTIILTEINNNIFKSTTIEELVSDISKHLELTYGNLIKDKNINLTINNTIITPKESYFDHETCLPFNRELKVYKLVKDNEEFYFANINGDIKCINPETNKVKKYNMKFIKDNYLDKGFTYKNSFSNDEKECIRGISTFTFYHPDFHFKGKIEDVNIPRDRIQIFRDGRLYGNWEIQNGSNGSKNYNDNQINVNSKEIIKQLGLTFNKNISRGHNNDISDILNKFIESLKCGFNADTSQKSNEKLYNIAIENNIFVPSGDVKTDGTEYFDKRPKSIINNQEPIIPKPRDPIDPEYEPYCS